MVFRKVRKAEPRGGREDEFAMHATTQFRPMLASPRGDVLPACTFGGPVDRQALGEAFKKSLSAADLQRLGRHLAQQRDDAEAAQSPTTILRNHGLPTCDHLDAADPAADRGCDGNLTAAALATHPSKTEVSETEERAGAFWMDCRQVVSTGLGMTREKQCDADV